MAKWVRYCQTRVSAQLDSPGNESPGEISSSGSGDPGLLLLDERDTVAVATRDLVAGEVVKLRRQSIEVRDPIPFGHKVALERMPSGTTVTKYGEVIGITTADIDRGEHAHVHNVVSARLPGPGS
jgi:altronate dehydratase small subunit